MGEANQMLLAPSDSASTSPELGGLTPESSDGDGFIEHHDNVVARPLLGGHDDGDEDEVYELSGGVRTGKGEDGRGEEEEEEEEAEKSHNGFNYTAEEEQAVVRKFDRRLVLFVALLYMLSFLDRSSLSYPPHTPSIRSGIWRLTPRIDIGNAYVAGMDDDLLQRTNTNGGPDYYEWALSSFYVAYIAFEWMSLLWNHIPAHIYISAVVLSWGVLASLQAVSTSYPVLIALRFLLGIGEAGFTGIPIYLSFFFKREELALRTAVFISAAPLATAFASSLAWVIIKLGENGPIAPWRLLFLIEGFPGVLAATVAYRVIPDSPAEVSYLTRREKKIARLRLGSSRNDETSRANSSSERSASASRRQDVLRDPVPWTTAGIFCLTNMAYASLPVFLPSILTQMGHTPLASQALAAPPYLVSFAVVLAVAKASDRLQSRAYLIAGCALFSSLGYAFLALSHSLHDLLGLQPGAGAGAGAGAGGALDVVRYMAVYPAAMGFFCVVVLTIAWNVNNARGSGHKGAGFALMQVLGQCGPLVGTRLYPKTDGPWFTRGMGVCSVAMLAVAGLALVLRSYLVRVNRQLAREGVDREGMEEEEGLVGGGGGGSRYKGGGFRAALLSPFLNVLLNISGNNILLFACSAAKPIPASFPHFSLVTRAASWSRSAPIPFPRYLSLVVQARMTPLPPLKLWLPLFFLAVAGFVSNRSTRAPMTSDPNFAPIKMSSSPVSGDTSQSQFRFSASWMYPAVAYRIVSR
ncbi:hypothetical protein VM1G_03960 [Cytospora mali]|uniref:Major facilitator superfamily (MFS) profile domain-containing protein n=1 Tax=Cytospora mali TaxID=578113 RepID=A0A194VW44_CYTMA|nr:hypothetical protein VM1G_03960 [Valsa mali]